MGLFFRVSGIVCVLLVFMGVGIAIGAKRGTPLPAQQPERFIHIGGNVFFDQKTGKDCRAYDMSNENVQALPGFTIDGSCEQLVKQ